MTKYEIIQLALEYMRILKEWDTGNILDKQKMFEQKQKLEIEEQKIITRWEK